MRFTVLTALAALTAACGTPQTAETRSGTNVASNAGRIADMADGQRNAVFIRAIRDAGLECQHVEASQAAGNFRGHPVWSAECDGGRRWTIVLTATGAQILEGDRSRLVTDADRNHLAP